MTYQKNTFYSMLLMIVIFSSCKDHNEYRVGSEFTEYLQRFRNEAAERGRTFNVEAEGLIIEFANLKNNTAGLTHYEDPIRVEIDETYWNDISSTAGADLMKENLIFHELGHGLLNRSHLNSTLENGDWKSIMCGGDMINDREWNINYRGERRAYYIAELFNESTPIPNFASTQFLAEADTLGFKSAIRLTFDTPQKQDAGWPIESNSSYTTSINNGRLKFESKIDMVYLITAKTPINIINDFSYELTLEYPSSTDATSQYGLIFGTVPDASAPYAIESMEYFTINNNKKMYMGNRTWYSFFTELTENQIITNGANKLKVFKIKDKLYYFINNVYSYCSEIEAKKDGFHYGFMVPPHGTLYLENFNISKLSGAGVSSKMKEMQPVEFEIRTANDLKHNRILNK